MSLDDNTQDPPIEQEFLLKEFRSGFRPADHLPATIYYVPNDEEEEKFLFEVYESCDGNYIEMLNYLSCFVARGEYSDLFLNFEAANKPRVDLLEIIFPKHLEHYTLEMLFYADSQLQTAYQRRIFTLSEIETIRINSGLDDMIKYGWA